MSKCVKLFGMVNELNINKKNMAKKIHQYNIGKSNLYYFYRFVVLPWELEWVDREYNMKSGRLNKYCKKHSINLKSFSSTDKLNEAISTEYDIEKTKFSGLFWFVRIETKPKDTLRHLRNCFAHGSYQKRQKDRTQCIVIENINKGLVKAKGFIPINKLKGFVHAICSCIV